jgi:MFS family permease
MTIPNESNIGDSLSNPKEQVTQEQNLIFQGLQLYHFINDGLILLYPILMVTYFTRFSLDWLQTGITFATSTLLVVIFQIICGHLVDKGLHKQIMLVGMIGVTSSGFLLHLVNSFETLLIVVIIMGIFFGFVHSINYTITIRIFPKDQINLKLARQGFAGDLGKLVAIFLSSLLLIFFDISIPILAWNLVCVVTTAYTLSRLIHLNFHQFMELKNDEIDGDTNSLDNNSVRKSRLLQMLPFFVLLFLYNGIWDIFTKNLATYLSVTRIGFIADYSEFIFAILMLAGTIGVYNAGTIRNKLGLKNHLIIVYTIMLVSSSLFVFLQTNSTLINLLLLFPFYFFMLTVYTNLFSQISRRINKRKLGISMGLLLGIGWMGGFTGNAVGGILGNIDPDLMFVLAILFCIISLILIVSMKKQHYLD